MMKGRSALESQAKCEWWTRPSGRPASAILTVITHAALASHGASPSVIAMDHTQPIDG